MRLINYSLKVCNKMLLDNLSISFENKVMNHLLGSNGVGKSCFAKSMVGMIPYTGIVEDMEDSPIVISSYSNVPLDFKLPDIIKILEKKFDKKRIDYFYKLLKLDSIPKEIKIKKMSDGQKQKIKLLCFLMPLPKVIILDEFTSALDKKSCLEVYSFLNDFVKDNDVTCINITHNLSDVEYMPGKYYLFNDRKIQEFDSKDNIISAYVKGGV